MSDRRDTHCENCVQRLQDEKVFCTSCGLVSYCSTQCREDDFDHTFECSRMDEIVQFSDQVRFMTKLLLKLQDGAYWDKGEQATVLDHTRKFKHLLSHSEELDKAIPGLERLHEICTELAPEAAGSWDYFIEVYGRVMINSFEVNDKQDDKVGWALYLAPSILNHSCVPNAEAEFTGKEIIVRMKVNLQSNLLSDVFISYIGLSACTAERRAKLAKYYFFHCMCLRCQGLKLSWVAVEEFNPKYAVLIGQEDSVHDAVLDGAKGKERDFLWSLRCPNCTGRPVKCTRNQLSAVCSYCQEDVDKNVIDEYQEILVAVDKMLAVETIPCDAPMECLELMTGVVYPYCLSYIRVLELAIDDCLLQNKLQAALGYAGDLLSIGCRHAGQSAACVQLRARIARITEFLNDKKQERIGSTLENSYIS